MFLRENGRRQRAFWLGIPLVLAFALWWSYHDRGNSPPSVAERDHVSPASKPDAPSPAAVSQPPQPNGEHTPPTLITPSLSEYRKEVARNPEAPPPSVLRFAAALGPRMDEALKSEEAAQKLLPDLEDCALARAGHDAIASVQATCLSDAHKLGRQYPGELGDRVNKLTAQSEPRVVRLLSILPASEQ